MLSFNFQLGVVIYFEASLVESLCVVNIMTLFIRIVCKYITAIGDCSLDVMP